MSATANAAGGSSPSNVASYKILDSTLREADQWATNPLSRDTKVAIAKALDSFAVDYIEITSPSSSEQALEDSKAIAALGLKVDAGVRSVGLVVGASSFSSDVSHEKSMEKIQESAVEVIAYLKSQNVETQFSFEDTFRSDLVDLLSLYQAVKEAGADRVGINDIIGGTTPRLVDDNEELTKRKGVINGDIECRFHDETGCAVGNAVTALEAGATHIDTTVLGIGERNGLVPLGAFSARMLVAAPEYTKGKYNLKELKALETVVSEAVNINVPYNNPVTGFSAFTHKAGIHAKAILNNPSTYEVFDPAEYGISRNVAINSRVTGWNAVRSRVDQLGLVMTDDEVKAVTAKIKQTADTRPLTIEDTDNILHAFHAELKKA
uniref:Pyruvate carboxyltransferase domain-containing protein n=1 Tax=Bionectria ochroleuca TaxID=29856 RepID=A0A0B7JML8_BIOOC